VPIQPKQPTTRGPAEWFTGDVFLDAIVRGEEPSRVRVSAVRFTPSARTAWHAHAVGQTLYVAEGKGLVQSRGGAVEEIRAGDVISTPPDQWHWHGAAPDHFMTHLSITEAPRRRATRDRLGRPGDRRPVPRPLTAQRSSRTASAARRPEARAPLMEALSRWSPQTYSPGRRRTGRSGGSRAPGGWAGWAWGMW
jgi:quercetin dioxygenase-like cupin family protein